MHLAGKFLRTISSALFIATISCFSFPAFADCTWYFNWYCSDCAKIGGQTTGTQGGYPSESSCDSARGGVASGVTTGSCSSSGYCDSPAAVPSPGYGGGTGYRQPQHRTYVPQIDYEAERRRQEAEQRRLDAEEAKRQAELKAAEEKRRRQFMKDKAEALGSLKGGVDFDGSGSGEPKIKSSPGDSLGLKDGNSGGALGLKDGSSAVYTGSDKLPVVDPRDIKGKQKYTRIEKAAPPSPVRDVPKRDVARLGTEVANLVMDAIQANEHDLDKCYADLLGKVGKAPRNQDLRDATSYILGMSIGNDLAGNPVPKLTPEQIARDKAAVRGPTLLESLRPQSPFPASPKIQKWEQERFSIYQDALSQYGDNITIVRENLEKRAKAAPDDMALRGALRIAQGVEVYKDDINRRKTSNTLNK